MVFSSLIFLCLFLPLFLALYFLAPPRLRNLVLLLASLVFYAWGEPVFLLLMLYAIILNYALGLALAASADDPRKRKLCLGLTVLGNMATLGFFKYADFIIFNINALCGSHIPLPGVPLPIGISFYTFQAMSYTLDVYRQEVPAQKNLVTFATFVTMFPQLIAGPIVRYSEVRNELAERQETIAEFASGVEYFTLGLCHKVLLANSIGELWDRLKVLPPEQHSAASAWLGILAFALQIYFDFGGYSLMAIGMGKMLGFAYPRNFNYPYLSQSISEFWRRWHITLGSWFREYVYIPLGGNRHGLGHTLRNLGIVWLLTGIWHGAAWNFLLWGLYYGLILAIERLAWGRVLARAPRLVRHIYTLSLVFWGWVLFEAESLPWCWQYLGAMFGIHGSGLTTSLFRYELLSFGGILAIGVLLATDLPEKALLWLQQKHPQGGAVLRFGLTVMGLFLCLAYIVDASYNPFLYFRF